MLNERQKSALLYTTFIDSDGKPQKKALGPAQNWMTWPWKRDE